MFEIIKICNKLVKVKFIKFIRPEKKFKDLEQLKR